MVSNYFIDYELQKLLGKRRVQFGFVREIPQPADLLLFPLRVGWR
jgi:hypothetical protein